MDFTRLVLPFDTALLLGMLIFLEVGRRLGIRKLLRDPEGAMFGLGVVEAAVFGLYGLLLAFTFSGAPERLDARRRLIAIEANAITTAYLRLDLLAPEAQIPIRALFRKYLDSRIKVYEELDDGDAVKAEVARYTTLQKDIWRQSFTAARLPDSYGDSARLLLPALNEMIDITTTRTMAARQHPPLLVYCLLFLLAQVCSLLAGYSMARAKERSALHIVAFVMVTVISVYAFLEIEYPRLGIFQFLDASDQVLVQLRENMK